ncbi:hypothetical protein A2U01_0074881, partial [Trifolium medium]|nr:hypothetical protein [Trifolium medium]
AEVEPVVVIQLSVDARPASSPYDASQPAPAAPDTGDALLTAGATSEPTCYLQGPYQ